MRRLLLSPWTILLVAAVVRVVAWIQWSRWPGSAVFIVDPAWHARLAAAIAGGDIAAGTQTWIVTPGPAYLLALGDVLGLTTPTGQAALQLVLGLVAVRAVYQLGKALSPDDATGAAAGWLAALSGPLIFQDLSVLAVSPALLGLTLATTSAITGRRPLLGGLALGLGAWIRPNFLLMLPVLLVMSRRRAPLLALGFALAVAPATVRNLVVGGEFSLISANGGYNLALSHEPGQRQNLIAAVDAPPNLDAITRMAVDEPAKVLGYTPRPAEADRWWAAEARRRIFADPAGFLLRTAGRAWLAVGALDVQDHRAWHAHRRDRFGWIPDPAFVLPGLTLLGLASLPRRRRWELAALVGAGVASIALFVFFERYRLPLLGVVLPLAGAGLVSAWGRPARGAAVVLGVGLVASFDPFHARIALPFASGPVPSTLEIEGSRRETGELAATAGALLAAGREEDALAFYERAHTLTPERPDIVQNLAALELKRGDTATALALVEADRDAFPSDPVRALLACSVELQAHGSGALAACEAARALDPRSARAWWQAGMARWAAGDTAGAQQALGRALKLDPNVGNPAAVQALRGR